MAGPGTNGMAAEDGRSRDDLRASHADRERVIGTLKAAFVQGMLAKDEFDLRVARAFASRTYAELAAVTDDLAVEPAAGQPSRAVRPQHQQPVLRSGRVFAVATALYAGVWAFTFIPGWPVNSEGDPPKGVVMLFFVASLTYLFVLIIVVGFAIAGWRERRSGRQPPRRAVPSADG
jgi:hypothetical protein